MRKNKLKSFLFILLGLTIAGAALFAEALQLDTHAGWGRARIAALSLGTAISLGAWLNYFFGESILTATNKVFSRIAAYPVFERFLANENLRKSTAWIQRYWLIFPVVIFIIAVYVWFVSAGTWTTWVSPTRFYANLARGFERGNLYLPANSASIPYQLPDLSDPEAKWGHEVPFDVSLYKGKLYLHWGPVPALLLVALDPFISGRVGDLQLVFGFVCGILTLQIALMVVIWDRFFRGLPIWLLSLSILLAGLAGPTTFILTSSRNARIYEAAVTSGQFFLMAGLLAVLFAMVRRVPSRLLLVLAGTFWALAIGSRVFLVVPVGILILLAVGSLLRSRGWRVLFGSDVYLLVLLPALAIVGLGWYNWARFGSVMETGMHYQWPGGNFLRTLGDFISPGYIVQNLYNYLLHPYSLGSDFPYLYIQYGISEPLVPALSSPTGYGAQYIAGLLLTSPFILFSIPVIIKSISLAIRKQGSSGMDAGHQGGLLGWSIVALSATSLSAFGFVLFYFWGAMRFMLDFFPVLILLSVIGFWQAYRSQAGKLAGQRFLVYFGIALAGYSILVSMLLAISVDDLRFLFI
jgi:hypothetical protein